MTKHFESMPFFSPLNNEWDFLKNAALSLGFVALGAVKAGCLSVSATNVLEKWIETGMNADMRFLERTLRQRTNICHTGISEQAEIVIVAALPYGTGTKQTGIWKHISCHARGVDYHITVKNKLRQLADLLVNRYPKCKYRVFSDSAPVAERYWAVTSGIGTIGKSGALLVQDFGPKVLLGEIVCKGLPLSVTDQKIPSLFEECGSCQACVKACPTGALLTNGTVNSERCLSYWTIERKDRPVPIDIEEKIDRIFGCDICTQICPKAETDVCVLDVSYNANLLSSITLEKLIQLDDDEINRLVADTPMERTGPKNLRKNAQIVLKNMKGNK